MKLGAATEANRFSVLGIPISIVDLPGATDIVASWAELDGARTVFVREVASLMAAVDEPRLAHLHHEADLIVPDGTPLVWAGKLRGLGNKISRVPGADLLEAVCERSLLTGQSHYFYGGKAGVAAVMAERLSTQYPGLKVVGVHSPPMREIGPDFKIDDEMMEEVAKIKATRPDFIWVGISSPKQEYWMMRVAPILGRGVLFGVGAAFDFHSGAVRRAPAWMRNNGLEWAHRLMSEPRRLWKRYLILAPRFVLSATREFLALTARGARKAI